MPASAPIKTNGQHSVTNSAVIMSSINNNNNSSSNNNININNAGNSNSSTEQPQTKRQKIEKVKFNSNGGSKSLQKVTKQTVTTNKAPPPDIIDTGEHDGSSHNNQHGDVKGSKHLCSSLSSSAHSISTPSSSNNSPTSTPSSSRATSLSQLLNVQNLVNILPPVTANAATVIAAATTTAAIALGASCSSSNVGSAVTSGCSSAASSSGEQSADEVDRIAPGLPDLLPTIASIQTCNALSKIKMLPLNDVITEETSAAQDMREFEESLTKQCLCGVSERTLHKPFQSHYSLDANGQKRIANLCEWPTNKLLQFLSNLQLLFDIYLKQNSKGFICARIMDVCDVLIRNDRNLIDEIIVLASYSNVYVQFLAGRVLASFLVIAKQDMDDDWLKKLVDNLFNFDRLDHRAVQKIHFSLEIIKRIVEWKDVDLHPLEDEIADTRNSSSSSGIGSVAPVMPTTTSTLGNDLDAHAYLHFQPQQPTLETNYFAVHFRSADDDAAEHDNSSNSVGHNDDDDEVDVDDEDDDDDIAQEFVAARTQQHNLLQLQQFNDLHVAAAAHAHLTGIPLNNFLHNDAQIPVYQQQQHHQQPMHLHLNHEHHQEQTASTTAAAANTNCDFASTHYESLRHFANNSHASAAAAAASLLTGCHIITRTDSESFDTTHLKCITIKILENKWPALVKNMSALIANHLSIENAENCILNFLQLWENIISVKANLSIVETLPFYAQLDKFELLLNQNLSCTIYKQMLCLFNEALCYGSTLALQDMLPDETCLLAHQIVRHVKDFRILESLPRRQPENIVGFIGFKRKPVIYTTEAFSAAAHSVQNTAAGTFAGSGGSSDILEMDKTILQKMVLLVLKSIAVTVKEIRSDSSDSSIDSTDYDAFQDMVLIERSIRDVLRKLESFIKHTLEFHPECHFSKILIHLFDDQDDHLIEAMVCTLDVTAGISFRNNAFPELVSMLNPVYTFLEFLKMISNSSDLLLDLLVSNETCFLLYLLRFLKYIRMNWAMFVQSCHDFGMGANTLDEGMSVLIRLRLQISRLVSRQLYPYDISPVLRLLESCESLYEGNELS